ncbi:hypothetical protein EBESD8_8070 [Rhodococcus aetherivorans]|nr:hypothetical protein EBESD8_8070 [Rhodococcus aetherivorans]
MDSEVLEQSSMLGCPVGSVLTCQCVVGGHDVPRHADHFQNKGHNKAGSILSGVAVHESREVVRI